MNKIVEDAVESVTPSHVQTIFAFTRKVSIPREWVDEDTYLCKHKPTFNIVDSIDDEEEMTSDEEEEEENLDE